MNIQVGDENFTITAGNPITLDLPGIPGAFSSLPVIRAVWQKPGPEPLDELASPVPILVVCDPSAARLVEVRCLLAEHGPLSFSSMCAERRFGGSPPGVVKNYTFPLDVCTIPGKPGYLVASYATATNYSGLIVICYVPFWSRNIVNQQLSHYHQFGAMFTGEDRGSTPMNLPGGSLIMINGLFSLKVAAGQNVRYLISDVLVNEFRCTEIEAYVPIQLDIGGDIWASPGGAGSGHFIGFFPEKEVVDAFVSRNSNTWVNESGFSTDDHLIVTKSDSKCEVWEPILKANHPTIIASIKKLRSYSLYSVDMNFGTRWLVFFSPRGSTFSAKCDLFYP